MLASEYHSEVPLCRRLLHALGPLSRVHILDDLDGMLGHLVIDLLLMLGDLGYQLIRVLIGTFAFELPV
jgi:hypothetical protein